MIDIRHLGIMFRGYPVEALGRALVQRYPEFILGPATVWDVLDRAVDLAGAGEAADWHFSATYLGVQVWIERSGGIRVERGHHGGYWTIYLPEER